MKDDTIKREDAIGAINGWLKLNHFPEIGDGILYLVPSADRPRGEWIEVDDSLISCKCSICGWESHMHEDDVYGMPYCPNCGARMKGTDDEISCR